MIPGEIRENYAGLTNAKTIKELYCIAKTLLTDKKAVEKFIAGEWKPYRPWDGKLWDDYCFNGLFTNKKDTVYNLLSKNKILIINDMMIKYNIAACSDGGKVPAYWQFSFGNFEILEVEE